MSNQSQTTASATPKATIAVRAAYGLLAICAVGGAVYAYRKGGTAVNTAVDFVTDLLPTKTVAE